MDLSTYVMTASVKYAAITKRTEISTDCWEKTSQI
jgi:hypothetical protein